MKAFDVIVIGGGPAGLAAAISARKEDARVILIEREERLGGILKQCIHDGFGLLHFGEKLSGPEYAERFEQEFLDLGIDSRVQTFVTDIRKKEDGFVVTTVSQGSLEKYKTAALILATGCRERTAKQVSIHGTRPSGVFTAGTAQHFVNLMGQMPTRRCVILGSGDIGLIMARRLTLEGAEVLGVYEVKPEYVLYDNAVKLAKDLRLDFGARYDVFVSGSFIFGDFLEAFIIGNNAKCKKMTVSTLSLNQNNVDSLYNLLAGNYIDELNLIVSVYFWGNEIRSLIPYMYRKLDFGNKFQL